MTIHIKRIYDLVEESDGIRILVDRLWPRGIKKENAKIDLWLKEVTPSSALRQWYHSDLEQRWDEFKQRYRAELTLDQAQEQLLELKRLIQIQDITLLTASKNMTHNHIEILKDLLLSNKK